MTLVLVLLAAAPIPVVVENLPFEVTAGKATWVGDYLEVSLLSDPEKCDENGAQHDVGLIVWTGPRGELPVDRWLKADVNLQGLYSNANGYGALRPTHAQVKLHAATATQLVVEFEFNDDYDDGDRAKYESKGKGKLAMPVCGTAPTAVKPARDAKVEGPLKVAVNGKPLPVAKAFGFIRRWAKDVSLHGLYFSGSAKATCESVRSDPLFTVYEPAYVCTHSQPPGPGHAQFSAGQKFPRPAGAKGTYPWNDAKKREWVSLDKVTFAAGETVTGTLSIVDAAGQLTIAGQFTAELCEE